MSSPERKEQQDAPGALEFAASYEPDEERAARALLLIAGLPPAEVELVVSEMRLESDREM